MTFPVLLIDSMDTGNSIAPLGKEASENMDPSYVYTSRDILYLNITVVSSILYFTIASTAKLSILCMSDRLFSVDTAFRRQVVISGLLVLGFWIGCTVAAGTNAVPLQCRVLDGVINPGFCFNFNIFWMAAGSCEVLIDVIILTLPARAVSRLQLSTKRKITVILIFLLGGL